MVADSMKALDDATNKLLISNAENIRDQSVEIAKLTGQGSIKMETIEKTWEIIFDGIEQTKKIEEENKKERVIQIAKMQELQNKISAKQLN